MTDSSVIYLDHAASTSIEPRVLDAMIPVMAEVYANPSSIDHAAGAAAAELVHKARRKVADWLSCEDREVIFTGGATEANNLALRGVMERAPIGAGLIISSIEHPSVFEVAEDLRERGYRVDIAPVGGDGVIDLGALEHLVDERTALVSVMTVNNETGAIQPVREIGELVRSRSSAVVHTDAVQASLMSLDVDSLDVDLMTMSGHKIGGPKGVGALYVRRRTRRVKLRAQQLGGKHERGLRSGTINVAAVVGMGVAADLAAKERAARVERQSRLAEVIERHVAAWPGVELNVTTRAPHITSIHVEGIEASAVMRRVSDEVAISLGSACATNDVRPSRVLEAMGLRERSFSTIRISTGDPTTVDELERGLSAIGSAISAVAMNRQSTPA